MGKCKECEDGYYLKAGEAECGACNSGCKCSSGDDLCTSCLDETKWLDSVNKNCNTACTSPCKTCSTSATTCVTCVIDKFLNTDACDQDCDANDCNECHATDKTLCVECVEGHYLVSDKCTGNCDGSCKTCSGSAATNCLSCENDKWYDSSAHTCTTKIGNCDT